MATASYWREYRYTKPTYPNQVPGIRYQNCCWPEASISCVFSFHSKWHVRRDRNRAHLSRAVRSGAGGEREGGRERDRNAVLHYTAVLCFFAAVDALPLLLLLHCCVLAVAVNLPDIAISKLAVLRRQSKTVLTEYVLVQPYHG